MEAGDTKKNSRSQATESGHTLQARHGGLRAGAMDSHHDVLFPAPYFHRPEPHRQVGMLPHRKLPFGNRLLVLLLALAAALVLLWVRARGESRPL